MKTFTKITKNNRCVSGLLFTALVAIMSLAVSSISTLAEGECTDAKGCVEVGVDEPIKLGTLLAMLGENGSLGKDSLCGVQLAIDFRDGEFDGIDGQVLGHDISLVIENDNCDAAHGKAGAELLMAANVAAVIGTSCSGAAFGTTGSEGAAEVLSTNAGILMVSPSATSPRLTAGHPYPFFARTAYNDKLQGKAAAEYARNVLGVTSAATIHDGGPYPGAIQQVFADEFAALGGTITNQVQVAEGDDLTEEQLNALKGDPGTEDDPQLVFVPLFMPQVAVIMDQLRANLPNAILMSSDSALLIDFAEYGGGVNEGVYVSGPDVSSSGKFYKKEFSKAYQMCVETCGHKPLPGTFHSFAYDATNLVLDAIEEEALVNEDGSLSIPRTALRDHLYATSGYGGLSGILTCDEFGDCNPGAQIGIFQVQNGEFVRVQ